jgi:hypothetical protein
MNILINSYANEVFNTCVYLSKKEIDLNNEKFQQKKMLNNVLKSNLVTSQVFDYKDELNNQFFESKKEINYLEKYINVCEELFAYITTHLFMSKKFLDVEFVLFYFKDQYLEEDPHYLDRYYNSYLRKWFKIMEREATSKGEFGKVSTLHQQFFYLVVNEFMDDKLNLKKIIH